METIPGQGLTVELLNHGAETIGKSPSALCKSD